MPAQSPRPDFSPNMECGGLFTLSHFAKGRRFYICVRHIPLPLTHSPKIQKLPLSTRPT